MGFLTVMRWLLSAPSARQPRRDLPLAERSSMDTTLEHAKEGYKNAQDVIKFIDTKTAVVTGLSTLIGGSLVAALKWSVESEKNSHATLLQLAQYHPCVVHWFYIFVAGCFAATFVCIGAAVWSVIARARPRHLENTFTLLFPIYKQRDETAACEVLSNKLRGISKEQILLEYEDQLRVVGMILGKKLKHVRIACIALLIQLVLFVFAVGTLSYLYIDDPEALGSDSVVCAGNSASLPLPPHLAEILIWRAPQTRMSRPYTLPYISAPLDGELPRLRFHAHAKRLFRRDFLLCRKLSDIFSNLHAAEVRPAH
jgi:hypothetical protein